MSSSLRPDYVARIRKIARELGIPADYAERRGLAIQPEAERVISIGVSPEGNECRLAPQAARAWLRMQAAAEMSEIELLPLSCFRSVDRQAEIVRGKLALGESLHEILHSIAAPGYSEHHTGRAIDVGCAGALPLEEAFADTRAYAWLVRHAAEFGFHLSFPKDNPYGFVYEPWHWCWQETA